ncbi:MAG: hypothetical protein QXV66_00420 [Candidatus Rehaiarchaeum fermentans]|nr:glycosyltransferase family 39 protein [Candidatus Rehaiarchaeum fermentans]
MNKKFLLIIAIILTVYFSSEFIYYNNWDFISRLTNAKFLLNNGPYIYINNAPLENFLLEILIIIFKNYSPFIYFFIFSLVFLFSAYLIVRLFNKNEYYVLALISPFLIFFGIKNGSELPVISFILITFYFSIKKNPLAGLSMGLAILSKFYALFFLPVLFFGFENKKRFYYYILLSLALLILILTPYFVFMKNLIGFSLGGIALSFWSTEGLSPNYLAFLVSTIEIWPFILFIVYNRKRFLKEFEKRKHLFISAFLLFLISIYIGVDASKLAQGLVATNEFRFTLPSSVFISLLTIPLFKNKKDLITYFALSYTLAIILFLIFINHATPSSFINSQYLAYKSVFQNKTCIVQSNNWIYLDYLGVPSIPISFNSSIYPIISNLPLSNSTKLNINSYTFYISGNKCSSGKIILGTDTIIIENKTNTYYLNLVGKYEAYNKSEFNPCKFAFDSGIIYDICMYPNFILN